MFVFSWSLEIGATLPIFTLYLWENLPKRTSFQLTLPVSEPPFWGMTVYKTSLTKSVCIKLSVTRSESQYHSLLLLWIIIVLVVRPLCLHSQSVCTPQQYRRITSELFLLRCVSLRSQLCRYIVAERLTSTMSSVTVYVLL